MLPAKGVGNFRAIAELGRVLQGLTGTRFDLTFIQDRDGMPAFIESAFAKSQAGDGVAAQLLKRHEVESYLLEPALFEAAASLAGRKLTQAQARDAIVKAAGGMKAKARRASVETAKGINRHLQAGDRLKESDLEEKVYEWFDALDATSLDVIQTVFPGKETLAEALKVVNEGASKCITRGNLVASIAADLIASDVRDLLIAVSTDRSAPRAAVKVAKATTKKKAAKKR